jgi:DNA-3-methyladenine glycosylase
VARDRQAPEVAAPARALAFPGAAERKRLLAGLAQPPAWAARALLGQILVRRRRGRLLAARIVETEAYLAAEDPAAHAFHGRTARTAPLWGPPGTLYVYFVYGVHHCLNVAVDREGVPGCVLVRAAEPLPGYGLAPNVLSGPGRLCRALGIGRGFSGRHAFERGSTLYLREGRPPARIARSPRIGIRHAAERPLRFFDAASAAISTSVGRGRPLKRR